MEPEPSNEKDMKTGCDMRMRLFGHLLGGLTESFIYTNLNLQPFSSASFSSDCSHFSPKLWKLSFHHGKRLAVCLTDSNIRTELNIERIPQG